MTEHRIDLRGILRPAVISYYDFLVGSVLNPLKGEVPTSASETLKWQLRLSDDPHATYLTTQYWFRLDPNARYGVAVGLREDIVEVENCR